MRKILLTCIGASSALWASGVTAFVMLDSRSAAIAAIYAAAAWALATSTLLRTSPQTE